MFVRVCVTIVDDNRDRSSLNIPLVFDMLFTRGEQLDSGNDEQQQQSVRAGLISGLHHDFHLFHSNPQKCC